MNERNINIKIFALYNDIIKTLLVGTPGDLLQEEEGHVLVEAEGCKWRDLDVFVKAASSLGVLFLEEEDIWTDETSSSVWIKGREVYPGRRVIGRKTGLPEWRPAQEIGEATGLLSSEGQVVGVYCPECDHWSIGEECGHCIGDDTEGQSACLYSGEKCIFALESGLCRRVPEDSCAYPEDLPGSEYVPPQGEEDDLPF